MTSSHVRARRVALGIAFTIIGCGALLPGIVSADSTVPSKQMQVPGPEAQALAQRTGVWDVVMTLKVSPDAEPVITRGLIAEREMVGQFLQEKMHPAPGSTVPAFSRIAYLGYDQVEGRWQYVSLDTRMQVGIMPASSFDRQQPDNIEMQFAPIGFPGVGETVDGQMVRSNMIVKHESPDHEVTRQFWIAADGTSRKWLAVQYEYSRHR
jgi:Protein of unknown function (DUF1579)